MFKFIWWQPKDIHIIIYMPLKNQWFIILVSFDYRLACTAASMSSAAIPSAAIVLVVMLCSVINLPTEDVSLLFAVDWLVWVSYMAIYDIRTRNIIPICTYTYKCIKHTFLKLVIYNNNFFIFNIYRKTGTGSGQWTIWSETVTRWPLFNIYPKRN